MTARIVSGRRIRYPPHPRPNRSIDFSRVDPGLAIARLVMMRRALPLLCLLTALAAQLDAQEPSRQAADERAKAIASLERLMTTGEPRHTSHDEGQWLQAAVDAAVARGDRRVVQMARRAAVPLLAQVTMPVLRLGDGLPVAIEMPRVLAVPATPSYRAEFWASVDGGDLVPVGTFSSAERRGNLGISLPQTARDVGLHHLRLRARLTYAKSALPAETRDLPELVYAIYDPRTDAGFDVRTYVESAKRVSARRLDGALPDQPFAVWLHQIAETRGGRVEDAWRIAHCDEFSIESALPPRTRDLCTVAYVAIEGAWAEVWLRTGRVELGETEVRWLSETPSYEGMRLHGSFAVEPPAGLTALSDLLAVPPAGWPSADLSIAPGDVEVTSALDQVRVSAVIRNSGNADARNAYVDITVSTGQDRGIRRGFVIDVPGGSSTQVKASLPLGAPYAVVSVHVMQISEHSPHDAWNPDPTPDDAVAFRIVNAGHAPRGYADWIRSQLCGGVCRGF